MPGVARGPLQKAEAAEDRNTEGGQRIRLLTRQRDQRTEEHCSRTVLIDKSLVNTALSRPGRGDANEMTAATKRTQGRFLHRAQGRPGTSFCRRTHAWGNPMSVPAVGSGNDQP